MCIEYIFLRGSDDENLVPGLAVLNVENALRAGPVGGIRLSELFPEEGLVSG